MLNLEERIRGAILGLLVGDALGVPYEFNPPEQIPPIDAIEMQPPPNFVRSHNGVAIGTWSDDGAHALALLESLLDCGRLDLNDFAQRLVQWYEQGRYAVGNRVFDVGIQTSHAIHAIIKGTPADQAGSRDDYANGNGSLMRVLPLALWHQGSDDELVKDAHDQSLVTHGHIRSQVCCALYCLWARRILQEVENPWDRAVNTLRELYTEQPAYGKQLELHVRPDNPPDDAGGSGYVVDTLHSARLALQEPKYQAVVRKAIALGHDTDTTACVAGGLAGLRDGVEVIPLRWREALREKEFVEPMIVRLLERFN
jgi:ADP-ribosyl-[dinitrogen reductase] hydrolase